MKFTILYHKFVLSAYIYNRNRFSSNGYRKSGTTREALWRRIENIGFRVYRNP